MQTKKTAPFGVLNNTKQADSDYQYNQGSNYNLFEYSCALACPVPIAIGKHRAGLDFLRRVYILSFACAKESNKEKHTGNDIQPLPDAVI